MTNKWTYYKDKDGDLHRRKGYNHYEIYEMSAGIEYHYWDMADKSVFDRWITNEKAQEITEFDVFLEII